MARWKLMVPHYLTVEGIEWEITETDRATQKQVKRRMKVPRYVDPKDPSDWTSIWGANDGRDGEVIVCMPGKGEPRDIVFHGDPTPDMIPVDDEAMAISQSFAEQWQYKPDMPMDHSQSLINRFEAELEAIERKKAEPVAVPGLSELADAIKALVSQNQAVITDGPTKIERRA
jgi:hypothetical protein